MGCDVNFRADIQISGKYYTNIDEVTSDISSLEEDIINIKEELRLMIAVNIDRQIPNDFEGSPIEYIIDRTQYLFDEFESKNDLLVKLYILLEHVKYENVNLKDLSSC